MAAGPQRERKVISVLFCDLVGFTAHAESMDPEDVAAFLAGYHDRVRGELERFGGTVEKFIGDAVMALFGAPVAHEDDAERAVRAALAIRDRAREDGDVEVRIGITTGEALVTLGAGEPTAAGDVVNTASRLQSAARENAILVDDTTRRATRQAITYAEAEPIEAKGKSAPVAAHEAVEARSRFGIDVEQDPRTALIGRQRELALLREAFARAREAHEPQLVTLVGVPGIGKSRLVFELSRETDAVPELVTWRQGRCLPYGEGVTFWALAEMVKAEAGILETDAAEDAAPKVTAAVEAVIDDPRDAEWAEANLRPLVGLEPAGQTPGDHQEQAFAAWRRFLEALAEHRPTVLVFEDLHWADEGLLDFVDYLVDWAGEVPLVVVCTARPELLARRPTWGGGRPNAATISLSPLSTDETARLVHALLERAVLPAEAQAALLERVSGNPLYAEEFVRMVAERPAGADADLPLPETLHGVIAARLDALTPDEKGLLQDAAVLGKVFWPAALGALGDRAPAVSLDPLLHALERKQFVRRERRSAVARETQYAFHHLLVRDAAYGQITRAERARKHLLAADWIESLARDRSQDRAEMLAHHYLAALELAGHVGLDMGSLAERATPALREAGDRALTLNAFDAAERFYASALELAPADDPARPYVLFSKATAGAVRAPHDLDAVEEAIAGFLEQGDFESAAEAECFAAVGYWTSGRRAPADDHLERALALVADAPPSPAKARVLAHVSRARMWSADYAGCVAIGREALAMADASGLDETRAGLLNIIGTSRVSLGDDGGLEDVRESLAIGVALNAPDSIHRSYHNLGECYRKLGRLAESSETLAEERRSDERFGLERLLRDWVAGEEAVNWYHRGDWTTALERAEEVIRTAESGSAYMESAVLLIRATLRAWRGDEAGADADSARAVELARAQEDPQAITPVLAGRAHLLAVWGRTGEASELVDELCTRPRYYTAAIPLAWAAVDVGRSGEVLRGPLAAPETPWEEAAADIASMRLAEAASRLGAMGAVADEAYARLRSGSADDLQRAVAFYRSVGATLLVAQGEAQLAATA